MGIGYDWDGYGDNWENLRKSVLKRDNHNCQRCQEERGPLQAHHINPRSQGGADTLANLITLCRPCHAVQHPDNDVFDDSRPDAPLFPRPNAPKAVAKMRTPDDRVCQRCRRSINDCMNLLAYDIHSNRHLMLCKPCAGVLYDHENDFDAWALRANHRFPLRELSDVKTHAPPHPSGDAAAAVATEWFPERTADHTTATRTETTPERTETKAEPESFLRRILPFRDRLQRAFDSWKSLISYCQSYF
jgi:hypothetical protein